MLHHHEFLLHFVQSTLGFDRPSFHQVDFAVWLAILSVGNEGFRGFKIWSKSLIFFGTQSQFLENDWIELVWMLLTFSSSKRRCLRSSSSMFDDSSPTATHESRIIWMYAINSPWTYSSRVIKLPMKSFLLLQLTAAPRMNCIRQAISLIFPVATSSDFGVSIFTKET